MANDVRIRRETAADARSVRRVHEDAFGRSAEADLVAALVTAGAVSLSLVAEYGGDIVGHVLFSPVTIAGASVSAVGLAPMAVLPAWQRKGIGSRLVRAGLEELQRSGHELVVVLGHPSYYPRFGFVRASQLGLRWEHDCPDEAFMALELHRGALSGRSGVVRYRPELSSLFPSLDRLCGARHPVGNPDRAIVESQHAVVPTLAVLRGLRQLGWRPGHDRCGVAG